MITICSNRYIVQTIENQVALEYLQTTEQWFQDKFEAIEVT